jgi:CRISPR-associated protein Csd1
MILKRLHEYAERSDLPTPGYGLEEVRWFVDVTEAGELEGFVRIGDDKRGERMVLPTAIRGSNTVAKPFFDSGEYVFGLPRTDATPGQRRAVPRHHEAFMELTRECARAVDEPAAHAVVAFLERWEAGECQDRLPQEFDARHQCLFRVGLVMPAQLPSVARFWAANLAEADETEATCLVTGEHTKVALRLPVKIKGIPGGQTTGTSLVSANNEATEHYGLKASLNSPISRGAVEKYGMALNALLRDEKNRVRIGPLVYVFWARRAGSLEDFASFLMQPDPERVKGLLLSPYKGTEQHGVGGDDFYALALSAAGGRVVVRDYLETTVPEVEENLKRWFLAQSVPDTHGQAAKPLGIFALAASAFFEPKDIQPRILLGLLNAALKGQAPPAELLSRAVARNRAEGDITRPRAALIRLVLRYQGEGEIMEETTAYNCGQLLAELEAAQTAALGDVGATLTDKYFGMASTAPASAFGLLLRLSQRHMSKLQRDKPGLAHILRERIEETTTQLGSEFPRTLTLREQGVFALGYYNQRAASRAERKARWEAKNVNEAERMEVS